MEQVLTIAGRQRRLRGINSKSAEVRAAGMGVPPLESPSLGPDVRHCTALHGTLLFGAQLTRAAPSQQEGCNPQSTSPAQAHTHAAQELS